MSFAPLQYDEPLYRPPSEGRNLIIQATIGCSFNRCTFCAMYKTKHFHARPLADVCDDIAAAARWWPDAGRIFLADGDALVLPTETLERILERLAATFPKLERVSSYATPINLTQKTPDELRLLREKGLTLVYVGVESGAPAILSRIRKGATPERIAEAMNRARDAGIAVSATVILGVGGKHLWREHVAGTAAVINAAPPAYLSTLQLRLGEDEVEEFVGRFQRDGTPFEWQDDAGVLEEQEALLAALDPPAPVVFRSNHASNCLPLAGTLPGDRNQLLQIVSAARKGAPVLRPEFLRGL
ncbi:radical SAM protein [Rhodoplanes elegans]|uniref:Radical SAM protein n=1 Tax=Rhodoplanes elegans TaxID=29408 RepID=A0A327K8H1_9BRAD|nr:radical SAM protein [Rhodoplanes elegans]MBK5957787.1 radical SAM protein [Rhodoplanes elegans]RAI34226.1 radical SAM protein [Rhodoplanes elegans]